MHKARATCLCLALLCGACATAPPLRSSLEPPVVPWEEKLRWMMRLEDQRLLRDPNPPPPLVLVPATNTQPAIVAPPPPSDLIRLLGDPEARVRRRAALSLGRVGLPAAVEPLTKLLADEEPDVRQMSAFALGLIGSPDARSALLASLRDARRTRNAGSRPHHLANKRRGHPCGGLFFYWWGGGSRTLSQNWLEIPTRSVIERCSIF